MRKFLPGILLACSWCTLFAQQQKEHHFSIAFVNTNSAAPFGKLARLFGENYHPGFEIGDSFNWKTGKKHDWFQNLKAGYFSHRFIQQSILLYTEAGYRYKLNNRFSAEVAAGAGYLHSIPATQVYKSDGNGNYKNAKGIGRPQAMADLSLGAGYQLLRSKRRPLKLILHYQQRLQFPFVKSYVPLLPYNSIIIGISAPFHKKTQN